MNNKNSHRKRINQSLWLGFILCGLSFAAFRYSDIKLWIWGEEERLSGYMAVVQNDGQWPEDIAYRLRMQAAQIDFKKDGLHFVVAHQGDLDAKHDAHHHPEKKIKFEGIRYHGIEWFFEGANPDVRLVGNSPHGFYYNYLLGDDRTKWAGEVPVFRELRYEGIYEGIDLLFYENNGRLKYDFIVAPGADPNQIKIRIEHAERIRIRKDELRIQTSVSEIRKATPYTFQIAEDGSTTEVDARYELTGNVLSFNFPEGYDQTAELVIDPDLIFSSYSGAASDNWGNTATFGEDGSLYAGSTAFGDYPIIVGPFQDANAGGVSDIGISKFSADGSTLLYSTFIGGSGTEVPHSMIENSEGQLVILSTTSSADFPTTTAAFDQSYAGGSPLTIAGVISYSGSDMAVTVLNATGSSLIGSTYLGGSENDGLIDYENFGSTGNYGDWFRGEVVVDGNDNIYVGSVTESNDIPTTLGAIDTELNNGGGTDADGYVFSLNRTCSNLRWATYLGGADNDACTSIKFAPDGTIFTSGFTQGTTFPTTPGVVRPNNSSNLVDAFISRLSLDGEQLLASSFLGTNQEDWGYFVDFDDNGRVYIVGQNSGSDYPITGGVYSNPGSANFIHCLEPDLETTVFSTQIGNGGGLNGRLVLSAFLVDNCRRIYISGWGGSTNSFTNINGMPLTSDAFQSSTDGSDFYLLALQEDASDIEYGSYFGGSQSAEHVDGGTSRFSREGDVYQAVCAGCGGNSDFPTSPGVVSNVNGSSNCNLGVFKFEFGFSNIEIQAFAEPDRQGCAPMVVEFLNFTVGDASFFWDFDDGTTSTERSPTHTFTEVGVYEVVLTAEGLQTCVIGDQVTFIVEVEPELSNNRDSFDRCGELDTMLVASQTGPFVDYLWSTGSTDSFIMVDTSGIYWVETDGNNGCTQIDSFFVEINPIRTETYDIEFCEGLDTILSSRFVVDSASYLWQDSSTLPTLEVNSSGVYVVETFVENECPRVDIFNVTVIPPVPTVLDTGICEGDFITIGSSAVGSNLTYTWNDNFVGSERDVGAEGFFEVVTTGDGFCTVVDQFVIGYTDTFRTVTTVGLCEDQDTLLSSTVENAVFWAWNTGSDDRSITVDEPGEYRVISQDGNCIFLDQFFVVQEAIRFDVETTNISCDLEPTGIIDIQPISGLDPVSYSIDGVNFTESTFFDSLFAGDYTVTGMDTFGCSWSIDVSIDTPVIVDVSLDAELEINLGDVTTLVGSIDISIDDVDTILWTPEDIVCEAVDEDCLVQEVMPVEDASYSLEVITVDGCRDIAFVNIAVIFERNVYVPNVFSPNGDGINDLFQIFAEAEIIENIHGLQIFDRWGNLVYDGKNFIPNDVTVGWDGTFKGEPMNPAVFVWQADIEFINGVREIFSGDLTLVR